MAIDYSPVIIVQVGGEIFYLTISRATFDMLMLIVTCKF